MTALEPSIRSVVTTLIDEIVEQGEGDLAEALANTFPTIAIALMLGLPEKDWPWFRERAMSKLGLRSGVTLRALPRRTPTSRPVSARPSKLVAPSRATTCFPTSRY